MSENERMPDLPKHDGLTDRYELWEMYKCAMNKHKTVRPAYFGSRRWQACLRLVKKGYLIPKKLKPDFDPKNYQPYPETLAFTEKGEDWILSLNPQDFSEQWFWPLPRDIEEYQEEIKQMRLKKQGKKK